MKKYYYINLFLFISVLFFIINFDVLKYNLPYYNPPFEQCLKQIRYNDYDNNYSSNVIFLYSYDYKSIPEYAKYSILQTQKYCKLHNYQLIEMNHYGKNNISPYWLRINDLIQLTNNYSNDTIFVYLDLDTIINPKYLYIKINKLLYSIDQCYNNKYDLYIGKDVATYKYINTGVMFIKNTEYSRFLLNKWFNFYNPLYWKYQNNKWKCERKSINNTLTLNCKYAGFDYEQGALEYIYNKNLYNSKLHIKILPFNYCSNKYIYNDSFIYHFMGGFTEISLDKNRLKKMQYIYNN